MNQYSRIFILAFLLDGSISLIDALLDFIDINHLSSIRMLLANAVLLLSLGIYLSLGFSRKLPKRIYLPLCLFVFWVSFSAFPLAHYLQAYTIDVLLSFCQLSLGLFALYWELNINKSAWQLEKSSFSFKYSGLFVLINIVLLPLIISIFAYSALVSEAQNSTAGFMRLTTKGLYLQERHYQKKDKNIRLVAMIHIGQKEYYQDLSQTLLAKNAVILAEGVSDVDSLLKNSLKMDKLAEFVGLSSQHEMYLDGNLITQAELEYAPSIDKEKVDIVAADIDANEFTPETLTFLATMGEYIAGSDSVMEWMLSFYQWSSRLPPQTMAAINNDILNKRNQTLLHYLTIALTKYDTVVIPWGAMHMPEFERAVLEKGFSLVQSKERLSIEWAELNL